jgi:hypothetical protein
MAEIHDRMPVMIPADLYRAWLDSEMHAEGSLLGGVVGFSRSSHHAYAQDWVKRGWREYGVMGSEKSEKGQGRSGKENERPRKMVRLARVFYLHRKCRGEVQITKNGEKRPVSAAVFVSPEGRRMRFCAEILGFGGWVCEIFGGLYLDQRGGAWL